MVSDDRRWCTFSGVRASDVGATATTAPGTAATPHPVAATSGAPTVDASAWASSRNGGRAGRAATPRLWSGDQLTPADLTAAPLLATTTAIPRTSSFHFPLPFFKHLTKQGPSWFRKYYCLQLVPPCPSERPGVRFLGWAITQPYCSIRKPDPQPGRSDPALCHGRRPRGTYLFVSFKFQHRPRRLGSSYLMYECRVK